MRIINNNGIIKIFLVEQKYETQAKLRRSSRGSNGLYLYCYCLRIILLIAASLKSKKYTKNLFKHLV